MHRFTLFTHGHTTWEPPTSTSQEVLHPWIPIGCHVGQWESKRPVRRAVLGLFSCHIFTVSLSLHRPACLFHFMTAFFSLTSFSCEAPSACRHHRSRWFLCNHLGWGGGMKVEKQMRRNRYREEESAYWEEGRRNDLRLPGLLASARGLSYYLLKWFGSCCCGEKNFHCKVCCKCIISKWFSVTVGWSPCADLIKFTILKISFSEAPFVLF